MITAPSIIARISFEVRPVVDTLAPRWVPDVGWVGGVTSTSACVLVLVIVTTRENFVILIGWFIYYLYMVGFLLCTW